jgi:hypothetical protein
VTAQLLFQRFSGVLTAALLVIPAAGASTVRGKLVRMEGAAATPVSGIGVRVTGKDFKSTETYSGYDGMYYFDKVPPGAYSLEVSVRSGAAPALFAIQVGGSAHTDIAPIDLAKYQPIADPDYEATLKALTPFTKAPITPKARLRQDLGIGAQQAADVARLLKDEHQMGLTANDLREMTVGELASSVHDARIAQIVYPGFEAELRSVLLSHPKHNLFVAPKIDRRRLGNARSAARIPREETVVGLMDATIMGLADDSMAFCEKAVYYHTRWPRQAGRPVYAHIPYTEFPKLEFTAVDTNALAFGNGQYFSANAASAADVISLLNAIKEKVVARLPQ